MAKLIILALALTALVAFASAYTTTITTITITEENPSHGSEQECRRTVQGQQFNQCLRYVLQQSGSGPRTLLMSINKKGQHQKQQQPQELQQCCNELQNVREECQCEAVNELFRQIMQQQQQGSQQQGGQQQMDQVRRIIQNLPNQCNIDVQQCQTPSAMF